LGTVGATFLAVTPRLEAFSFHNISVSSIGDKALFDSGVREVDVGGL
jgi:hypothetical protein